MTILRRRDYLNENHAVTPPSADLLFTFSTSHLADGSLFSWHLFHRHKPCTLKPSEPDVHLFRCLCLCLFAQPSRPCWVASFKARILPERNTQRVTEFYIYFPACCSMPGDFQHQTGLVNSSLLTVARHYTCLKFDQDDTADYAKIKISTSAFLRVLVLRLLTNRPRAPLAGMPTARLVKRFPLWVIWSWILTCLHPGDRDSLLRCFL